jgi:tripartite-type tricarboxylate transporter receptor subunit TctC
MKKALFTFVLVLVLLFSASSAFARGKDEAAAAEKFPNRPIQWIVPWGEDNESVAMGRIIANAMSEILGVNIVVSAMPGGSGSKALHHVLSQPADGYMLLDGWVAPLIFVVLNRPDIGYTHDDFTPIGHIAFMPFTLVVRKDDPRFPTLDAFVEYGKAHPGEMKYNATGAISVPHAVMATFLKKAGVDAQGVPYPGLAGGIKDFLGGTLDFSIGNFWVINTYGDETKTLCVFMDERHPWFPDLPTAKELGYDPGFGNSGMGWDSLIVKKGTPEPIVKKLRDAYKQAATDPEVIRKLENMNFWLNYKGPEETKQLWIDSYNNLGEGVEVLKAKSK